MDRQTNTDRGVARENHCAFLNFARFDSLVCIVARSREKSRSLSLTGLLCTDHALSASLTEQLSWVESASWVWIGHYAHRAS